AGLLPSAAGQHSVGRASRAAPSDVGFFVSPYFLVERRLMTLRFPGLCPLGVQLLRADSSPAEAACGGFDPRAPKRRILVMPECLVPQEVMARDWSGASAREAARRGVRGVWRRMSLSQSATMTCAQEIRLRSRTLPETNLGAPDPADQTPP